MYNRKTFFDLVRKDVVKGPMRQGQVDGFNDILAYAEKMNVHEDFLAYVLATVWWETDRTMQPIEEYGRGVGRTYGLEDAETGKTYYGRGYVQLTWKRNYELASKKLGVDFVNAPEKVMEPKYAVRILFRGMLEGWFTGKSLYDYIDTVEEDEAEELREFIEARKVVNGTDKAILIGNFAASFERVLKAAYQPNPKPLSESRTLKGVGLTATGLIGMMIEPANKLVDQFNKVDPEILTSSGFIMLVGVIGLIGALWIFHSRWDDAGRPLPWRKLKMEHTPEPATVKCSCKNRTKYCAYCGKEL